MMHGPTYLRARSGVGRTEFVWADLFALFYSGTSPSSPSTGAGSGTPSTDPVQGWYDIGGDDQDDGSDDGGGGDDGGDDGGSSGGDSGGGHSGGASAPSQPIPPGSTGGGSDIGSGGGHGSSGGGGGSGGSGDQSGGDGSSGSAGGSSGSSGGTGSGGGANVNIGDYLAQARASQASTQTSATNAAASASAAKAAATRAKTASAKATTAKASTVKNLRPKPASGGSSITDSSGALQFQDANGTWHDVTLKASDITANSPVVQLTDAAGNVLATVTGVTNG